MSAPKKFRKKPIEIEATQWDGTPEGTTQILDWINSYGESVARFHETEYVRGIFYRRGIYIDTLEGTMRAELGDFIIRGVRGEFYPCKPDIFEQTYEEVL